MSKDFCLTMNTVPSPYLDTPGGALNADIPLSDTTPPKNRGALNWQYPFNLKSMIVKILNGRRPLYVTSVNTNFTKWPSHTNESEDILVASDLTRKRHLGYLILSLRLFFLYLKPGHRVDFVTLQKYSLNPDAPKIHLK